MIVTYRDKKNLKKFQNTWPLIPGDKRSAMEFWAFSTRWWFPSASAHPTSHSWPTHRRNGKCSASFASPVHRDFEQPGHPPSRPVEPQMWKEEGMIKVVIFFCWKTFFLFLEKKIFFCFFKCNLKDGLGWRCLSLFSQSRGIVAQRREKWKVDHWDCQQSMFCTKYHGQWWLNLF